MAATAKRCPNCGKKFKPNYSTRKYCSIKCSEEYRKKSRREIRTTGRYGY